MTTPSPPTVWFSNPAAAPIGTEFVSISGGHLSLAGNRFVAFGVNIDQFAVLTPLIWNNGQPKLDPSMQANVQAQLDNLVNAGVRAVRLHGFDLLTTNNIFQAFGRAGVQNPTTRQLDPNFLLAFAFFWNEMRKRNLRAILTLHYRRQLTPNDRPPWPCATFDECLNSPFPGTAAGEMQPWFWFDAGLQQLQSEFNRQLLRWVNPLTGVALGDDPALLAVLLQNERSLVKDDPYNYPNQPVLQSLWSAAQNAYRAKLGITTPTLNKVQWQQCLADLETSVLSAQAADVRGLTKALVIAGTYFGNGPYSMLVGPSAAGDLIDFHFYSRYAPSEPNGFWSGRTSADPRSRFAAVAAGCDWTSTSAGPKPLVCTEWGPVGQYNPLARDPDAERSGLIEQVVTTGLVQDLDAIFLYSWGHSPLFDGQYAKHTIYDFRDDATLHAGAAAQIARFHDLSLRPASSAPATAIGLTTSRLFGSGIGPAYVLPGPYTDPDLYAVPPSQQIEMESP